MNEIVTKIGADKLLHLFVCIVLTMELKRFLPLWITIVLLIVIIIGKEVYDKISGKGTPEWEDILWGLIGMGIGCV